MNAKTISIETYILKFPVEIRLSKGVTKETHHLLVVLHTDSGVVGVGEGTPYSLRGKSFSNINSAYLLCKKLEKNLKGLPLHEAKELLPKIQARFMEKPFFDYGPFLALETAIIDALSKLGKVDFAAVLGNGNYRDRIPVCGTVFLSKPQNMAKIAQKWVSKGVKHLKVKISGKIEEDSTNLKFIRNAVDYGPLIRVDANEVYRSVDEAANAIRNLERYEIAIVEQPLKFDDLYGLKELRRKISPKIMVDESLRMPSDVELIAEKEAADIINFHPPKLGCLSVTRNAIEKTVNLGLEFMIGSAVMTGIGVAAHLHLAASIDKLSYPVEEVGLYEMFGRDIVTEPSRIVEGSMKVKNYGVGVEIDTHKLHSYNVELFRRDIILGMVYPFYQKLPSTVKKVVKKSVRIW